MKSRPIDDDPLPSYMKKIYDRNSCYGISAYSLKLNNFKNNDRSIKNHVYKPNYKSLSIINSKKLYLKKS